MMCFDFFLSRNSFNLLCTVVGGPGEKRTVIQDDELCAGLNVPGIVFCKALVEPLIGLDQTQNLQVVFLLQSRRKIRKNYVLIVTQGHW